MKPHIHILLALPITIILYLIFKEYSIIFFLSSFLFDIDHYIDYAIATKKLSLKKAYIDCKAVDEYAKKHNKILFPDRLHIFHTIEFYLIVLISAIYNKFFLFIFLGLMYHQLIDIIHMIICPILIKGRAISLIMWIKRHYFPSKLTKLKTL